MRIIDKFKENVEKYPNRIAYKSKSEKITYLELWKKANYYANYLKYEKTPIIIYGEKEASDFIAIIACLLAHRTYVFITSNTPIARIKEIIKLTNSKLLISNIKLKVENIDIKSLEMLTNCLKTGDININNNIAYIVFTSGSTGIPKGVPITYDNLDNFVKWISQLYPLSTYDSINVLNTAKYSFDLSIADIFYSLCNGHTLIAFTDDYDELFDILYDINVAVMTPTFVKILMLNSEFNNKKYKNLKCIYFCGETLEVNTVKKIYDLFPDINIINAYGPTEATSAVCATLIDKSMLDYDTLPVGDISTAATDIQIENDEIILKGKSVFNGYLNTSGGHYKDNNISCFKTGDLGYIKEDMLFFKGRIDNQIKYKGYRIELEDIESNLNQIEGIKKAIVMPKYNGNIVKMIKAFIILENDNYDENYIREKMKLILPDYMIPKVIKIIDNIPINANGKIDRKVLNEL